MNFKKRVNGSWVDTPNYIYNTSTDTITTLPADVYADGNNATVGLVGNMSQSGTPTPTTPIQPQETGERTGNLYNINAKDVNNGYVNNAQLIQDGTTATWGSAEISEYIPISGDTTYTFNGIGSYNSPCYGLYDENKQLIGAYRYNGAQIIKFTSPNNARYFRFTHIKTATRAMMVEGAYTTSTMPDYEPYGIKIPISSGGNNLWNEEYPNISGTIRYIPLYVGEGSFTLSTTTPYDSSVANLFLLSGNVSTGASTSGNGAWLNHKVTAQSDGGYITIAYRHYTNTTSPAECNTMLNRGSTALPYEPYVQPTLSNIYLGEVETTRKIGKLVLDGTENWVSKGNPATFRYENSPIPHTLNNSVCYCSHFKNLPWQQVITTNNSFAVEFTSKSDTINIRCDDYSTVEDFKAFLATQYANGTPVTIWYVLAEPTTGIVNEPIRKIGDYADEVSGITIPTTAGVNTISVGTTLQPSEVSVNYKGWHPVADVHEAENGQWD